MKRACADLLWRLSLHNISLIPVGDRNLYTRVGRAIRAIDPMAPIGHISIGYIPIRTNCKFDDQYPLRSKKMR